MKFSQLRLSGFKSFVEPTELLIKDGLTGIVGPNGCGKSNLVEALRWVMGETSAKNMRGGAMDDVIFAGTTSRPARNVAEVTLGLDNTDRIAPPAYNDVLELDITRRIRRETGSDYRINGKITRARDVQLLFADMATGAHSTAIVSQGRVGSLINAKPKDRRHLLEEAAGISGLHSRRHEAELRLKAAETNLERVDDVSGQLEVQLTSLKRQARQATRYRNISGHIRKAEAMLLYRKHEVAARAELTAQTKLKETADAVVELTHQTALAQNASLTSNEALKPLRDAEAAAAALVHRLALQNEQLNAEEERLRRAQQQLEDRKLQIASDMEREKNLEKDAAEAVQNLRAEKEKLLVATENVGPLIEKLQADIQARQNIIRGLQSDMDTASEALAIEKANHNSLVQQLENADRNLARQDDRLAKIGKEKLVLAGQLQQITKDDTIEDAITETADLIEKLTMSLAASEADRQKADTHERQSRDTYRDAEKDLATLLAEIKALDSLLMRGAISKWKAISEKLTVVAGYETALAAALGEDLEAPTDAQAPAYWSAMENDIPSTQFTGDIKTLDQYVTGEAAMLTRLSYIGVAQTREDGLAALGSLMAGQRIVSLEGDLWRWDGFHQKAGAKSSAAIKLEHRNRLSELEKQQGGKGKILSRLKEILDRAENALAKSKLVEQKLRIERREAEQTRSAMQTKHAEHQQIHSTKKSRLEALQEQESSLGSDISELKSNLSTLKDEQSGLPDLSQSKTDLDKLRSTLRERREELGSVRAEHDTVVRESAIKKDRLQSIDVERESWIRRSSNMAEHFSQLEIRFSSTDKEIQDLTHKPEELRQKRGELADQMARADAARGVIRDQVAEAEAVLKQCDDALRQTQEALSACREQRVRHQADVEHTAEVLENLAEQILEKLDCTPDKIKEAGQIEDDEEIPPVDISDRKVERLKKERDGMGPVNLRAEIEANEVDEQLTTLIKERDDLEAAIARLRQGIASLNKEGRERLLVAFKKVDTHFQELFSQVFGGGYAHLKLTESDDPLAAGLEIMASPPGKRLQLMSLLSGGEQALTAVALLFAVFLTNPAPICVLDEVDAPLDDVNVERLCNLLDRLSADSETRFLVVTHHPITMARMDRLFGVTMAERGISQLVSVDLTRAQLMTNETS
ncbi:MAG: chromosome segregation protein SMC [Pseudomonas marincola]